MTNARDNDRHNPDKSHNHGSSQDSEQGADPSTRPRETTAAQSISQNTVSQNTVSQNTVSQDTVSQDTVSQDTVSQDTTVQKTVGQLERELSQKMQALYKQHLGHQPSKVTCQLFGAKLAIVLEKSITPPEQLLMEEGNTELAEQVRADLSQALQPQIEQLIESVLAVQVLDFLSDATLDTARTGIIVVLSKTPDVRNPEVIPKVKK